MKLVLYGGGFDYENRRLDSELIKLVASDSPQLTYIPADSYMSHIDFAEVVEQYKPFGIKKFIHFPIDRPFADILKQEALSSDIIYLSGGNTYFFLANLRKKKLIPELKQFLKRGGVLAGLSAGAILMTQNIETAGFPDFDCDDNDINLKNLKAMSLVDFEFFPHYRNSKRYSDALLEYSMISQNPLYGCPDGAGIIVDNDRTTFLGKIYCFYQGEKFLVQNRKI